MKTRTLLWFDGHPAIKSALGPIVRAAYRVGWGRISRIRKKFAAMNAWFRPFDARSCVRAFKDGGQVGRSPGRRKNVVMLAISDLRYDPRIEREARALVKAGYDVTVIFPKVDGWEESNVFWCDGVVFEPAPKEVGEFANSDPGYIGEQLFQLAIAHHPFCYHAHDLNTAYVGLAAARSNGAHLICDFHEWFSENVTYDAVSASYKSHSARVRARYRWLEREALMYASAVVTVCDSIADAMGKELGNGRRPQVIRNIPMLSAELTRAYAPMKVQLGLPEGVFLLLWQGGVGPSRLIEPIIEALEFAPHCIFAIRGPSLDYYGDHYRAIARKGGYEDRLIILPPVPSRDVVAGARGADAGIWTLPRLCRNFTYALPNKIFEYTAANLALLVADFPEARRMVETHGIGLTFDPYNPRSIAAAINRLIEEPGLAEGFRRNTLAALAMLDGEDEWRKLVALYDALPRTGNQT